MPKEWINHLGQKVPATYVPKIDKKKERTALKFIKKAKAISKKIAAFKTDLMTECDSLYDEICEDANVSKSKSKKGNYSITSFDKSIRIEVSVQEKIDFDDKINLAQEKINEFINEKSQGVNHDLQVLINSAFQSSKGRLDTKRILGLFKLDIKSPKWLQAMDLIKQSIDRNTSKRYCRIFEKDSEGEYQAINLNFSSL